LRLPARSAPLRSEDETDSGGQYGQATRTSCRSSRVSPRAARRISRAISAISLQPALSPHTTISNPTADTFQKNSFLHVRRPLVVQVCAAGFAGEGVSKRGEGLPP
jgi:hypothetical protein